MKSYFLGICIIFFMLFPNSAEAVGQVQVRLPDFEIQLNGQSIDNGRRLYPFFVYQGITYFPLTYHDSRWMRLQTTWSSDEGLMVSRLEEAGQYVPQLNTKENVKHVMAQIYEEPVIVNGVAYDEQQLGYPVLSYGGIVYLPILEPLLQEWSWNLVDNGQMGMTIIFSEEDNFQQLAAVGERKYFVLRVPDVSNAEDRYLVWEGQEPLQQISVEGLKQMIGIWDNQIYFLARNAYTGAMDVCRAGLDGSQIEHIADNFCQEGLMLYPGGIDPFIEIDGRLYLQVQKKSVNAMSSADIHLYRLQGDTLKPIQILGPHDQYVIMDNWCFFAHYALNGSFNGFYGKNINQPDAQRLILPFSHIDQIQKKDEQVIIIGNMEESDPAVTKCYTLEMLLKMINDD